MMTFAHDQKYLDTISALIWDCSLCSSKKLSAMTVLRRWLGGHGRSGHTIGREIQSHRAGKAPIWCPGHDLPRVRGPALIGYYTSVQLRQLVARRVSRHF